ncbi:MAG: hypothetical protein WAV73_03845 [Candidatus Moraniibacteriota bacterium]
MNPLAIIIGLLAIAGGAFLAKRFDLGVFFELRWPVDLPYRVTGNGESIREEKED